MKKAEMEAHQTTYRTIMSRVRSAQKKGDYRRAVKLAVSSWRYVDGMMRYERKYDDKEHESIEGLDVVLKYAPVLFDLASLDALASLLKNERRIDRNTSHELADRLAEARELMWDAHRMWDHMERHPATQQDGLRRILGGDQKEWRTLVELWEGMDLVSRTPAGGSHSLSLVTRMSQVVLAKCPSCGVVAKAAKTKFLGKIGCPKCRDTVLFVILSRLPSTGMKE